MSGPQISSGTDSKQDYQTPDEFMAAVAKRFGPISFDLAAHAGNRRHPRYYAPTQFVSIGSPTELGILPNFVPEGGSVVGLPDGSQISDTGKINKKTGLKIYEKVVPNLDPEAAGLDAFKQDWAAEYRKTQIEFSKSDLWPYTKRPLWLNCEFSDIEPWARKCAEEARRGASILLLTPASVGSNWYRNFVVKNADVYQLNGRISFDGEHPYPKDLILSHFFPMAERAEPMTCVWEWRSDIIHHAWSSVSYAEHREAFVS